MFKPTRLGIVVGVVALIVAFSCDKQEPNWCADAPGNNCLAVTDAADAMTSCSSDQDCTGSADGDICDTSLRHCEQCVAGDPLDSCTGTSPICGSADTCRSCVAHAECSSDACLPDGSCGTDANTAYVAPTGTGSACTFAAPCGSITTALATSRPYIKVAGTINEQVDINNQAVTILADPGAKLTSTSNGILLKVDGASTVLIYDLEITGASGTGNPGISLQPGNMSTVSLVRAMVDGNEGAGISASAGTVTAMRSTIAGNVGGGISLSGAQFDIENCFITANGGTQPADTVGGVSFATISTAGNVFAFNTVTANSGASNVNSGVNCGTVTVSTVFDSNIIYGNNVSGVGAQLGPVCSAIYSDIGGSGVVSGMGNINADPLFVSAASGNYRLGSGSPCIDRGDPAATLDIDFDGDHRPQGSGYDIGADEVMQ